ncbi:MAG: DUF2059 domain-containing protein [Sulfitobacter sp.]
MTAFIRHCATTLCLTLWAVMLVAPVRAADRADLETFLEITGFDVALESIRLSARSAPQMLGLEADDFGSEWTRLVGRVFDTDLMHELSMDILEQTLTDELLAHGNAFYSSDLGVKLVRAENASHMMEDEDLKSESGQTIVAGLVQIGSPRLGILKRLNAASNTADHSIRAIQEVQVRFLMAAAAAGVFELSMEEPDLREALKSREGEMRLSMQASGLAGAAYTYQAFSDSEMLDYAQALEDPRMQRLYELMNAVQFEIMANRYEAVAVEMQNLRPSQDL